MGQDKSHNIEPDPAWRDIAEQLSRETDSDKITDLSQELIRAMDQENAQNNSRKQYRRGPGF